MVYTRPTQLNKSQLVLLRADVVLGSIFGQDYTNRYGIDAAVAQDFFDGYKDYIEELEREAGENLPPDEFSAKYDTADNLWVWAQTVAASEETPSTDSGKRATYKPSFLLDERLVHLEDWTDPDEDPEFYLVCFFGHGNGGLKTIKTMALFSEGQALNDLADRCFESWKRGGLDAKSAVGYPLSSLPDIIKSIMRAARTIVGVERETIRFDFRTKTLSPCMWVSWEKKTEAEGYTLVEGDDGVLSIRPWDGNPAAI